MIPKTIAKSNDTSSELQARSVQRGFIICSFTCSFAPEHVCVRCASFREWGALGDPSDRVLPPQGHFPLARLPVRRGPVLTETRAVQSFLLCGSQSDGSDVGPSEVFSPAGSLARTRSGEGLSLPSAAPRSRPRGAGRAQPSTVFCASNTHVVLKARPVGAQRRKQYLVHFRHVSNQLVFSDFIQVSNIKCCDKCLLKSYKSVVTE